MRPSSNTISPSDSGARKQRLRGVYANVRSANVLCTSAKEEAVFFSAGKPFVDLDAFKQHLHICCVVNLQSCTILDIQRARDIQRHNVNNPASVEYEGHGCGFQEMFDRKSICVQLHCCSS